MSEQKTAITDWLDKPMVGYMLNSPFSEENQQKLGKIINHLHKELPDVIWPMPLAALHITLLDWIAPLVDYGQDKNDLFERIRPEYDQAMADILEGQKKIKIRFSRLGVYPGAVTIEGEDDGSYKRIREEFLSRVELLPNTKLPPTIIHSSLCRFLSEIELDRISDVLEGESISFEQTIDSFRLVKETTPAMVGFEVVKTYQLD